VDELLRFSLGDGSVALELHVADGVLVGQLLVDDELEIDAVRLVGLDGTSTSSPVDELGRFSLRPAPAGPARLHLRDGSGRTLATDWFLL
jgi:hypothetical protein